MRNLTVKLVTSLIVMLLFVAVGQAQKYGKIKGSGKLIKDTRSVESFDKIAVSGAFDIGLEQGEKGKIVIDIEDNLLPYLETKVSDGKLKIKWKNGVRIRSNKVTKLHVYFNQVNSVSLSGSGDIVSLSTMKSEDFRVELSGSGDISLDLKATILKVSVSGSGDIDLKGTAKMLTASIAGSGDMSAFDLISETADV